MMICLYAVYLLDSLQFFYILMKYDRYMLWHDIEIGHEHLSWFSDKSIIIILSFKIIQRTRRTRRKKSYTVSISNKYKNTLYRVQIKHDKWVAGTCALVYVYFVGTWVVGLVYL